MVAFRIRWGCQHGLTAWCLGDTILTAIALAGVALLTMYASDAERVHASMLDDPS
jgi:hypothetical protein